MPEKILSNHDLEQIVATSDEWIFSRSGIKERRIIAENETTSDMAYQAALDAINSSSFDKSKIDMVIVATSTTDMIFPSTACVIQDRLGLPCIPAFDMLAACTGFIYAIATADAYIKSGMAKCVLVVGVDALSRYVDYTDRNTCVLFGDGAGAVILEASKEPGVLANEIYGDGSGADALNVRGNLRNGKVHGHPFIYMDGKAVFKMAVKNLSAAATSVLLKAGYTSDQLDWLLPHQANIRIIESTANHLSIPMEKVIVTVSKHGNTSAASVPLALDFAVKNGKIKKNDLVMLEGVGAGFTWGASLIRF